MIPRYRLLQSRILAELDELDRTATAVQRHWKAGLAATIDQDAYINSVALNLHSFYSGLERNAAGALGRCAAADRRFCRLPSGAQ